MSPLSHLVEPLLTILREDDAITSYSGPHREIKANFFIYSEESRSPDLVATLKLGYHGTRVPM